MDDPTGTTPDNGSYRVPNGWGDSNDNSTTDASADRVPKPRSSLPDTYAEVEFPGAYIREYWDATKADGTPWPKTYRMMMRGPDGMKTLDRVLALSGVVRISRLHQAVALTDARTRATPEVPNIVYTVRIDLGDDATEELTGSVTEEDLSRTGQNSSLWLRKLGLISRVHPSEYKTIRLTLFAKKNRALKTQELKIEDVYSETGMLRTITEDGEQNVFLTPGDAGALSYDGWNPDYKTELPHSFGKNERIAALGYRPASNSTVKESFAELFKMYDVVTERKWIPAGLIGTTGIAPMYGIHPHAVVALALIGKTKQMKTTLASLILPNQSTTERGRYVQPTINARSAGQQTTSYGMEKVLSRLGGFVVVVDDIITARQVNGEKDRRVALGKVESLVNKLYGERAIKGGGIDLATREIKLAEDGKPKASIVLTMEDFPRSEDCASIFNRMVVMEHDSAEYVDKTVLTHLQTVQSGSLRYNAQCYYVQELLRKPELFEDAWQEAGRITDGWEFPDFERERDNYRRILAGNIALLHVGKNVGVKGPTVGQIAKWLKEAAKLQAEWMTETIENDEQPLDVFRSAVFDLISGRRWGSFSAPHRTDSKGEKREKTTIVYPKAETLGPVEWHHLGYEAGPPKRDPDAKTDDESGLLIGSEEPHNLSWRRVGFFLGKMEGKEKPSKLGYRWIECFVQEFDALYDAATQWAKQRGKLLPSKDEFTRLMEAEGIGMRASDGQTSQTGKGRKVKMNADWLFRVGDYA